MTVPLAQAGRQAGEDLRRLAEHTATALAALHQQGIAHRNFNPDHVLLGEDGPQVIGPDRVLLGEDGSRGIGPDRVLLGEDGPQVIGPDRVLLGEDGPRVIGLAADASVGGDASGAGASDGGIPAYLAPERIAGEVGGPAADVFAWGCVIASAATGTPPFGDDSVPAVIGRITYAEPWLGDLPEPLRSVVQDCLAKDPAGRPAMREVLIRLRAGQLPVRRLPRRAPLAAMAVAAVAVSVVAAVVWNVSSADGADDRRIVAHSSGAATDPQHTAGPLTRNTARPLPQGTATPMEWGTAGPLERETAGLTEQETAGSAERRRTGRKAREPAGRHAAVRKASKALSLAQVRIHGASRHSAEGVTCYTGPVSVGVGIHATRRAAPYTYQWFLDGKVVEAGSSRLPAGSRIDYVTSRRTLRAGPGTHTVTYRITSPIIRVRSVTFAMCRP